jgi:chromosome segregation ATPase
MIIHDLSLNISLSIYRTSLDEISTLREREKEISHAILNSTNMQQNKLQEKSTLARLKSYGVLDSRLRSIPGHQHIVIGALCDLFLPLIPSVHTTALMAVLGSSLTHTIVVPTRTTAVAAAHICRDLGISSLTMDILEEIEDPPER